MGQYHIIQGGDGGWNKAVYADECGNIVSAQEVERERLKEEIKRELKNENGGRWQ